MMMAMIHIGKVEGAVTARADAGELPCFEPGAHISVLTPAGLQRKYSLINLPGERRHYVIAVRRDGNGRGGSVSMADGVAVGAPIEVCIPDNAFPLGRERLGFFVEQSGLD